MTDDDDREGSRLTRREFLAASAAAGFALAVVPVSAETIITDSDGLDTGTVQIPTADRAIPAFRAVPAQGGPFPLVVVVHEIFGVHEYIRDVCRRLAKIGYLALAPDLFTRQGDVTGLADRGQIMAVVARVPDAQVVGDLDSTITWAAKNGAIPGRTAIVGFCWGGRIVWLYAAHSGSVRAGVAWYGMLSGEASALRPKQPLDLAGSLKFPVLGLYGAKDAGAPPATVEAMQKALASAGGSSEIVVYPDAEHGFHADYRPTYHQASAVDGWKRMVGWFAGHGVGTGGGT